eukprot:scaffold8136_cov127-Cylindrotheca_fusiformis.AAC.27
MAVFNSKQEQGETETKAKEMEAKARREFVETGKKAENKAEELEKEVRQEKGEETMADKAENLGTQAKEMASNAIEKAKEMGGMNKTDENADGEKK